MISTSADSYKSLPFPRFSKPTEVDAISLHGKEVIFDRRNLKYFWSAALGRKVDFDLNVNFETHEDRCEDTDKKYLSPFFDWIQHRLALKDAGCSVREVGSMETNRYWVVWEKRELLTANSPANRVCTNTKCKHEPVDDCDFVCWRGLLQRVLNVPYEGRDGWIIACMRVHDVIFMYEYETPEKRANEASRTERERRMGYWGYKFETYVTVDSPEQSMPDTSAPAGVVDQYCTLMRTRLGNHKIFYGAEVDGLSTTTGNYVELKTSRAITHPNQRRNLQRFKFIKWWTQSFLVGIDEIIVGFRDDDGFVNQVESLSMRQIEKDGRPFWSSAVCFNFLNTFLNTVKDQLRENSAEDVYLIKWKPGDNSIGLQLLQQNSEEHTAFRCVPEWFAKKFERRI